MEQVATPIVCLRERGWRGWFTDARWFQIAWLCSLLLVGVWYRDFSLQATQIVLTFASALITQWLGMRWLKRNDANRMWASGDFLSGFITSFGISLLVRSDSLWVHPLVACIAIASKFILTVPRPEDPNKRTHIFNPANLAAILALFILPGSWLSPGQWGQDPVLALLFCALGLVVTYKAKRLDVSLMFIGSFAALLLLRIWLIEGRVQTVWHTLMNGSLLLFTFFMISDPMTTPQRRWVRLCYAFAVAFLAFAWQFTRFLPNGPVIALFALSFVVPVLNRVWTQRRFEW